MTGAWRFSLPGGYVVLFGTTIFAITLFLALFGHFVAPFSPNALVSPALAGPSDLHWLGTDHLGRDILSRVIAGARYTVLLAIGATGISLLVGILLGTLAGYFSGIADMVISRFTEVVLVIPRLFLVLLLVAFVGTHGWVILVVIGLTTWPVNARLMRAQVLSLRERAFVKAAEVGGVSSLKILVRHILPNSIAPIIANSTLQMAEAVLLEAGLSFLGLGDPNQLSWGRMIQEGQAGFPFAWWPVIFPGAALAVVLLALHLLGDAFSDNMSPRHELGRRKNAS